MTRRSLRRASIEAVSSVEPSSTTISGSPSASTPSISAGSVPALLYVGATTTVLNDASDITAIVRALSLSPEYGGEGTVITIPATMGRINYAVGCFFARWFYALAIRSKVVRPHLAERTGGYV